MLKDDRFLGIKNEIVFILYITDIIFVWIKQNTNNFKSVHASFSELRLELLVSINSLQKLLPFAALHEACFAPFCAVFVLKTHKYFSSIKNIKDIKY